MLSYPFDAFGQPLAQVLRETPHPVGTEVVVRVGSCGLCQDPAWKQVRHKNVP